jgi:hypothetical protein
VSDAPEGMNLARTEGQVIYSNSNRIISVTFHAAANANRCSPHPS